ncbi:PREDICTED: lipid phosphate phosphohydrolase 1-like isoform X2 [Dinoponera quadriceps]|uniref:Lipid phosphate phosphohydrolase 1-like isoform X2 n=1 Tax=Dinoponera quadriceps TaxID=609295 RepID=A0A6P3Y6D3_DINQU|nr:PREDICTED: lipid phosphate phosphohydrolase 1-like isoform X2 [Dinoponera quadriceps]
MEGRERCEKKVVEGVESRKITPRLLAKYLRRNWCALMVIVLAVLEFGAIPYKQFGFFCNDPKISHKFTGDTISMVTLLSSLLLAPLITIWIVECVCYSADNYKNEGYNGYRSKYIWTWYRHYIVVFIVLAFVCECIKILIGEPRPHFLDTCKPREAINCTDEYFSSYTCTNTDNSAWFVMDSSRSFPSGHAALSVFTCIFVVWYLQYRLLTRMFYLKPWLQSMACLWAVVCSATRVADKRHHWWDVAVGAVMGILFGMFLVTTLCRYFRVKCANDAVLKQPPSDSVAENGQISFAEK